MAHRDLQEWSPTALVLLPTALGWTLPLVTSSVHVSGFWWLLLLLVSLVLVAAIIFIARPVTSLSASSHQLETKIRSLEKIAETYDSELGADAQETVKFRQDLNIARERLATIQFNQAKKARVAALSAAESVAAEDRPTMILLGIIAIMLPFTLLVGHALAQRSLDFRSSLSMYYFSDMRDALVGGLCAMGVLFMRAREGSLATLFTTIAGMLAIAAALTHPALPVLLGHAPSSEGDILISQIHAASIGALVMLTAVLCLVVFPQADQGNERIGLRLTHNQIYRLCGVIIICGVFVATFSNFLPSSVADKPTHLLLWIEVIWLVAFGLACIVRGGVRFRGVVALELSHQQSVPDDHSCSVTGPGPAPSEAPPTSPAQLRQSSPPGWMGPRWNAAPMESAAATSTDCRPPLEMKSPRRC